MANGFSARGIQNIGYPLQAINKAIASGSLPKLNQALAPQGYDLAYNFTTLQGVTSPAAADAKLQALGGLPVSLVAEPAPTQPWWKQALTVAGTLGSFLTLAGGASTTLKGLGASELRDPNLGKLVGIGNLTTRTGGPMAFQDGSDGIWSDIFGGVNQALQGGLGSQLLNIGSTALTGFINQSFAPQPVSYGGAGAMQTMGAVPAVIGAGRAVATVGRGFFTRFPNLATAIQSLRQRGSNVSRSSLYSAMRRFGPEMLVSGGILTAAAVSELAVAGPGRRRMNPGNVKALRRAHRRMKSFHHVCTTNDMLLKRSRRK